MIETRNPYTDKIIQAYPIMGYQELHAKIEQTHQAFFSWKTTPHYLRSQHLLQLKDALLQYQEKYAKQITQEMGKAYKEALSEIQKCAWVCQYYAENAENFLKDEPINTEAEQSFITYQSLGVVLSIMPWNYPFWQLFRFAVPAIAAGNAVLLKHAAAVSGCALAIEEVFKKAGFPEHLLQVLLMSHDEIESVIAHPHVQAITFTGGTSAGKRIGELAGKHLKKIVLELGGSDPYLILEDANLGQAIEACVQGRLTNAGQSCVGAKRFIVVEEVYEKFIEGFKRAMQKVVMDDPEKESTEIGPLSSIQQRNVLHQQVLSSIEKGAKCILGGKIPTIKGAFYPPTILVDVKKGMPAYDEELFGPVASVILVKNTQEAIRVANDTEFGLGAAVFTTDKEKGRQIAKEEIESGSVVVNDFLKSDPRMPFGGVKNSGYGRELSYVGIREFVNIKSVSVF
jgi:succinate-semialdehyde dehydrogenase / glutarate-semialdehyde dehydrogenase